MREIRTSGLMSGDGRRTMPPSASCCPGIGRPRGRCLNSKVSLLRHRRGFTGRGFCRCGGLSAGVANLTDRLPVLDHMTSWTTLRSGVMERRDVGPILRRQPVLACWLPGQVVEGGAPEGGRIVLERVIKPSRRAAADRTPGRPDSRALGSGGNLRHNGQTRAWSGISHGAGNGYP